MLTERFGPMLLNQPNSFLSSVIKQEPIPQDGLVSEVLLFPELYTNLNFPSPMAWLGILKFSLDTLENHLMGQNPFYYPNSDTLDEKNICKLLAGIEP